MNEPENKFDGPVGGEADGSRGELESLRTLIAAALVLLIIFSASVDYYLSTQTSEMTKMLHMDQQTVSNYSGYVVKGAEFWGKLQEYAKTHPDFNPVIEKWKAAITFHTNAPPPKAK